MIEARNGLERLILSQPEIQRGLKYGKRRDGHPEGLVVNHINEILDRIDRLEKSSDTVSKLRLIAINHDSFKYEVNPRKPKIGANNHGVIARKFAEKFISDKAILNIIELHDTYYYLWVKFTTKGIFSEKEFRQMADRLKDDIPLFLEFVFIDGTTGNKSIEPRIWLYDKFIEFGYLKI